MISTAYTFLVLWGIFSTALCLFVDKKLMKERAHPGPGGFDYFTARSTRILYAIHVALICKIFFIPQTNSFQGIQFFGISIVASAMGLIIYSMLVNTFFSSIIRIQEDRGHHLITEGPYQWVRHPGYLGMTLLIIGGGLAFESWQSTSVLIPWTFVILRRVSLEETLLKKELPGYLQYCQDVRWKLIPHLF